jgi:hypothetical protein
MGSRPFGNCGARAGVLDKGERDSKAGAHGMAGPASLWSFEGAWRLERRIEHASGQGNARLSGMARFLRSGGALLHEESGTLSIDGVAGPGMQARRRCLWTPEAGGIAICFEDGRPFHIIPLGILDPEATHFCSPDRYTVRYDFSRWPEWSTVWRVSGPRKAYVMTSRLVPDR